MTLKPPRLPTGAGLPVPPSAVGQRDPRRRGGSRQTRGPAGRSARLAPVNLEPAWIELDGLRLRYLDTGEPATGKLPLLIIPGHTARIEGFVPMLPTLAAEHRVRRARPPGAAASPRSPTGATPSRSTRTPSSPCSMPRRSTRPSRWAAASAATWSCGSATGSPTGSPASCCGPPARRGRRSAAVAWLTDHVVGSKLLRKACSGRS